MTTPLVRRSPAARDSRARSTPTDLPAAVFDAHAELLHATLALDGFMCLLSGFNGDSTLEAEQLLCLLEPVQQEVSAAFTQLETLLFLQENEHAHA